MKSLVGDLSARSSSVHRFLPVCLCIASCLLGFSATASAQLAPDTSWRIRSDWVLTLDLQARWLRPPALSPTQSLLVDGQLLGQGKLPRLGTVPMLDVNSGASFTVNDRWVFPLIGIGFGGAVGPQPRVWTELEGTSVEMQPWTLNSVALFLPGAGIRYKHRRWSFQATVQTGVRVYWMSANAGVESPTEMVTSAATLFLVGQLETCRRFDPVNRGCLTFSPTLYEAGELNGWAVGLRWEFGP